MHTTVKGQQVAVGEAPRDPNHRSNLLESQIVFQRAAPRVRPPASRAARRA